MKKNALIVGAIFCFFSCQKSEKMKHRLFPERPYEKANIDKFYWSTEGWDYMVVPLIKPFQLLKLQGSNKWEISTGFNKSHEVGVSDITNFNVSKHYIYGYKAPEIHESDSNFNIPEYWFIIDTEKGLTIEDSALTKFNNKSDFKVAIKKLNLSEEFINPDEIFEQYKNDPVLPWFPEDIKRQLIEVKEKK